MTTPEGRIKARLDRKLGVLKDYGIFYFSPNAGPYGSAGIPDRIVIVNGQFVGVECKADGKKELTDLQKRIRIQIEAAGGKYFVAYDNKTIDAVIQWIVLELADVGITRPKSLGLEAERPK